MYILKIAILTPNLLVYRDKNHQNKELLGIKIYRKPNISLKHTDSHVQWLFLFKFDKILFYTFLCFGNVWESQEWKIKIKPAYPVSFLSYKIQSNTNVII